MSKPVFHHETLTSIRALSSNLPHAIGLHGKKGAGLKTTAQFIATTAGASTDIIYPEKKEAIDLETGTITIDIVRRLYRLTQSKSNTPRTVIIVAADTMSIEAQNAFLKLLEEPTPNTTFMLLIHHIDNLLPTVQSRLQLLNIRPITTEQSTNLLEDLGIKESSKLKQLLFIASGRPALLTKLSQDNDAFNMEVELLKQARAFLKGSHYDRLLVSNDLKDSRERASRMIEYALTILQFDIATRKAADTSVIALLDRLQETLKDIHNNANVRLSLTNVALS